LSFNIGLGAS